MLGKIHKYSLKRWFFMIFMVIYHEKQKKRKKITPQKNPSVRIVAPQTPSHEVAIVP